MPICDCLRNKLIWKRPPQLRTGSHVNAKTSGAGRRQYLNFSAFSGSTVGFFGDVCVFFTLNRYFYPSTSSTTTSVRADSSILLIEEIQVLLWSQSYATEILRCHVLYAVSTAVSGQCNVCVFFTLNTSFYPSTSRTTSVRADCSILEETQVPWSQSYVTEILRCHVPGMQ